MSEDSKIRDALLERAVLYSTGGIQTALVQLHQLFGVVSAVRPQGVNITLAITGKGLQEAMETLSFLHAQLKSTIFISKVIRRSDFISKRL